MKEKAMTDKRKGFIWGIFTGFILAVVVIAFMAHLANTPTPDVDPLTHATTPVDGGGVGGGPVYTPPDLTIVPSLDIPPPPAAPSLPEPAQAEPAPAVPDSR
jgi:hypothetical protein